MGPQAGMNAQGGGAKNGTNGCEGCFMHGSPVYVLA